MFMQTDPLLYTYIPHTSLQRRLITSWCELAQSLEFLRSKASFSPEDLALGSSAHDGWGSAENLDWVLLSPQFHIPITTCCGAWESHRWLTPKHRNSPQKASSWVKPSPSAASPGWGKTCYCSPRATPKNTASPPDWSSGGINCAISMTFCCSLNVLITAHPRNSFFLPHEGEKYPSEFFRLCDRLANCC